MKVEQISGGNLRIWLSDEELRQEKLYPPGEETRRMACRLVRRVLRDAPPPGDRLLAELIPVEGGGVLVISAAPPPVRSAPLVYRLSGPDALLDMTLQWREVPGEAPLTFCLYEQEEGYLLTVYPEGELSAARRGFLSEYATLLGSGEGMAAYAAEHGRLLSVRPDTNSD